jgi:iron complex outermembrane receptor protein
LLVARRTVEDAYIGVNAGQSLHPGFEAAFQLVITKPGTYPSWEVSGNTTISNFHFTDFIDNDNNYSGNNLPGTAKETFLATTSVGPFNNLNLNLTYRYVGKMATNDANTIFSNSFGLTNVDFQFIKNVGSIKLDIKGGINNIFDVSYASMLAINAPSFGGNQPRFYYPGNPRNLFFTLAISFNNIR